jgi:hypothetical protein
MQVPPETIVPNLIVGIGVIIAGLAVVKKRKMMNDLVQDSQRRMFGERIARVSAGRQTPLMMGVVGVLIVLVGIAMVAGATVGIVQSLV